MAHSEHQTFGAIADRLGQIKAQIADLKKIEAALSDELKVFGASSYEGVLYRAVIAERAATTKVDWEAIAKKLNPSRQLIQAYTRTGESTITLTVYARKTA